MTSALRRAAALIVEDQPFVGLVASDILREAGFETFHAYDAADALKLLNAHPEIRILLTEARLTGDVDGVTLSRTVARQRPDIRIIVAQSGSSQSLPDLPDGARVLRKPYASAELGTLASALALLQPA